MDTLLRFGTGGKRFNFTPQNQISLRDNFRDIVPRTNRLPGLDGGFDEYGGGRAPGEIGNIQVVFWVHGGTRAALDAIGAMATWGTMRLVKQPMNGGREQWCWARVNSIDYTQAARDLPYTRQRVTVNFQVADPVWRSWPFDARYLNEGYTLSSGLKLTGWAPFIITGATTLTINYPGNAAEKPVIRLVSGKFAPTWVLDAGYALDSGWYLDGQTVGTLTNPIVRRIDVDTLEVTHEVRWEGVIEQDDRLVIDAKNYAVTHEDASAGNVSGYAGFSTARGAWMELLPGDNRIDVTGTFTGSVAVFVEYAEARR